MSWEPLHKNSKCEFLASSSKDCTVKIWNAATQLCQITFGFHKSCVTKVIWGGQGCLYSSSEDKTIKVWSTEGLLIRELNGHGHWVNTLAVNTDFVLRLPNFFEIFVILNAGQDPSMKRKKSLKTKRK